jgi:hypothetical protein
MGDLLLEDNNNNDNNSNSNNNLVQNLVDNFRDAFNNDDPKMLSSLLIDMENGHTLISQPSQFLPSLTWQASNKLHGKSPYFAI